MEEVDGAANLVAMVLGAFALAILLYLPVGALLMKGTVRLLQGKAPGYARSLLTVTLATVAMLAICVLIGFAAGFGGLDTESPQLALLFLLGQSAMFLLAAAIGLPVHAAFVHWLLRGEGRDFGFGRALLIALVYQVGAGIVVAIGGSAIVLAVLLVAAPGSSL